MTTVFLESALAILMARRNMPTHRNATRTAIRATLLNLRILRNTQ